MHFFFSRTFWFLVSVIALFFVGGVARAEQLAVATDKGDTIELHDRVHGKCPPGIREAVYVWKDGHTLPGCWKFISDKNAIFVVWSDGDAFLVPVEVFVWKRGTKPVAL